MSTSAQIISFGSWRSPTPANTIEGRFYLLCKSRLGVGKRRLLRTMEEDLYGGSALCVDMAGALERPERVHEVPGLGYIAYFWSRRDHSYVLSEFCFEESDSGGGLPCGSRFPTGSCGGLSKPSPRPIAAAARAVAAGAIRAAGGIAADLRWRLGILMPSYLIRFGSAPSQRRATVSRFGSSVELASEVLAVHALLAGSGPVDREELPHWSLLREMVTVSEELRNPFARSLMAGELVCRLGSAADDSWRAASHHGWRTFLSRADADWSVPRDWRSYEDPTRLRALIAAWLSDDGGRSVDKDALRLLARARLSLVLASHVRRAAMEAATVWTCADGDRHSAGEASRAAQDPLGVGIRFAILFRMAGRSPMVRMERGRGGWRRRPDALQGVRQVRRDYRQADGARRQADHRQRIAARPHLHDRDGDRRADLDALIARRNRLG